MRLHIDLLIKNKLTIFPLYSLLINDYIEFKYLLIIS